MTPTTVLEIGRGALEAGLMVAAPMLGAALVTGLRMEGFVFIRLIYLRRNIEARPLWQICMRGTCSRMN